MVRLGLALPYRVRVPLVGWLVSRLVAPLAGYNRRIRDNLALVRPDLSPEEVRRMERAVTDNAGRTLIEIYSGPEFKARLADAPSTGRAWPRWMPRAPPGAPSSWSPVTSATTTPSAPRSPRATAMSARFTGR